MPYATATWASLPDRLQPPVGAKVVGLLDLTLYDNGRHRVALRHPAGRRRVTPGVDVADPYQRQHA